jgi:hypothetical protein
MFAFSLAYDFVLEQVPKILKLGLAGLDPFADHIYVICLRFEEPSYWYITRRETIIKKTDANTKKKCN